MEQREERPSLLLSKEEARLLETDAKLRVMSLLLSTEGTVEGGDAHGIHVSWGSYVNTSGHGRRRGLRDRRMIFSEPISKKGGFRCLILNKKE